jgi:uncharacterized protein (TIGR02246 family)
MRASARAFALSVILTAGAAGSAAAQLMPGGSPTEAGSFRRTYLVEAYRAIDILVVQWESAWLSGDMKELMELYTDDAVYLPASAKTVSSGRRAVQATLQTLLPTRKDIHTRMVDFTASGDMAYFAGQYFFQTDSAAGPVRNETGTFVFILQHSPRGWRIRSHVEKPDPDAIVPAPAASSATDAAATSSH